MDINTNGYEKALKMKEIEDILVPIPENEWPNVRDTFKRNWPYGIHIYYLIENSIRWHKKGFDNNCIIYSPEGRYDDGTIVVTAITEGLVNLHVFTYDKDCVRLKEALKRTKAIKWTSGPLLYGCHEDHWPHVEQVFQEMDFKTEFHMESSYHWISREYASKFEIKCPPDVFIGTLTEDSADAIDSLWPHRYPGSNLYVEKLIKFNGGLGIYLKSDGSLCSWITRNHHLGLGVLQTEENHKNKGYGKAIAMAMCKSMADEGLDIHAFIMTHNNISRILFKKLGFQRIDGLMFCKLQEFKG